MADTLQGFPYFRLRFDGDGKLIDDADRRKLLTAIGPGAAKRPRELFVIAHGWKTDATDGTQLYNQFFSSVKALFAARQRRKPADFAVVGVFWPSRHLYEGFADQVRAAAEGAAASAGRTAGAASAGVRRALDDLAAISGPEVSKALKGADLTQLENRPEVRDALLKALQSSVREDAAPKADDENDVRFLKATNGTKTIDRLSAPPPLVPGSNSGHAASGGGGGGQALGQSGSGFWAGVERLIELTSYYKMKRRAGVVGKGLAKVLDEAAKTAPDVPIHLIGHSFGARLVSSAASSSKFKPASLSLLQAAFSHHGFSPAADDRKDGVFLNVITRAKVTGPIIVTHTKNDSAVGVAYPWASMLSGDNASDIGGPESAWGGLGSNGAVKTSAGVAKNTDLQPATADTPFSGATIYNLKGDSFIAKPGGGDAHGEVHGQAVANAVLLAAGY